MCSLIQRVIATGFSPNGNSEDDIRDYILSPDIDRLFHSRVSPADIVQTLNIGDAIRSVQWDTQGRRF